MKKLLILALALVVAMSLVACTNAPETNETPENDVENLPAVEEELPAEDDVVIELPEVEAGETPAAGTEEEGVLPVMPEVDAEADVEAEMPEVDVEADVEADVEVEAPEAETEEPKADAPAEEVSIDELYAIADKLYEGFDPENMPMVGTMELTEENFEYSAFVPYKDSYLAVESMPMMGSMPHSIVIVRAESEAEAAALAESMKENANPRKWICVSARSVKSAHKGNYAILAMIGMQVMPDEDISEEVAEKMSDEQSEERVDAIIANFLKAVK